ncbi:MAG: disulfide bond formation protein B [Acidimicrobiales bacterium]
MDEFLRLLLHLASYVAGLTGLALVLARFVPGGVALVRRTIGGQELWFAFAAALAMTLTSLYLSEILHYIPCRLCWFQRIFAYSNVIVLGWAAVRRDRNAWGPALTLAGIGILFSTWHIALDVGWIPDKGSCDPAVPCTVRWAWASNGATTIQVGAFCCFLFIIGLGLHAIAKPSPTSPTAPAEA